MMPARASIAKAQKRCRMTDEKEGRKRNEKKTRSGKPSKGRAPPLLAVVL